jgi:uncharacterized protein YbaP (TraB family)
MSYAQLNNQKGLLWQITGNGLKKPSYVYGTMHVSQKIAFHLGDSFYIALSKSDVVALEQNLDSVIHKWITDDEDASEANKVEQKSTYDFLNLYTFGLSTYNKKMIAKKLSAEAREVNYLLKRGDQDDFEEDAWLDLYIYQLAKKMGKDFTGVEGFEESRELVKIAAKEPKDAKPKKKFKRSTYQLRQQMGDAYRKGDIYMIDSIDRMTESEHYLEYMLYKRNANMVRRMDSIMKLGKVMFTGVGCAHLPGDKGVLSMLIAHGYKVRAVQSIAKEKSKMAKKFEEKNYVHKYNTFTSDDGLISASLPSRLSQINDNNYFTTYLSPDLANSHYFQIEKIKSNAIFSGKSPEDILEEIDTMIFENIPGEITNRKAIKSNGFNGIEIITKLKTGDLNRFHILASPFNIYIVRLSGKKNFAVSKDANNFFNTLKINEGQNLNWNATSSPDSVFNMQLPVYNKATKFASTNKADPSYEHLVYEKTTGNTYLIKQLEVVNQNYLEEDTFELNIMSLGFASTDNFKPINRRFIQLDGYQGLDVTYENKLKNKILARFVLVGTRYLMFVLRPSQEADFNHIFFKSISVNQRPKYQYFEYSDTLMHFKVKTPINPILVKENSNDDYYGYEPDDEDEKKRKDFYQGSYKEMYFIPENTHDFIAVKKYKYGYYENQSKLPSAYFNSWKKTASLKVTGERYFEKNGVKYSLFSYTDTNTHRIIKVLNSLSGINRYYVEAYTDTINGISDFINTFINTFEIVDTAHKGDIFEKKGYRFIQDFVSKDSIKRKSSISYLEDVEFTKKDFKDLCNIIDTISMKGDAAPIRTSLIEKLSAIDSASDITIPYLQKLYNRFSDTAYLQIVILKAIASQKNSIAYQTIKPILANDLPISDDEDEMESMLYAFSDSLKLTKQILPELIALTSIYEYRNTAYRMLSLMKDSGIINEKDYANIHDRLVFETTIEYKRMMAALTKDENAENDYETRSYYNMMGYKIPEKNKRESYDDGGFYSYDLLSDILDLSLPLYTKSNPLKAVVNKILTINNNTKRLSLMPVLLKYDLYFHDSVYMALAKNKDTRNELYSILYHAKKLNKFPKEYLNQKDFVLAELYALSNDYNKIDTIEFLSTQTLILGKDTSLVYLYKFQVEEESNWYLYVSSSLPKDTTKLNADLSKVLFERESRMINPSETIEEVYSIIIFETLMAYKRTSNGGYYNQYANSKRYRSSYSRY